MWLTLIGIGFLTWVPLPAGVWNDDGVYLLIGKSLAEGQGLRYAGIPGGVFAAKFPPVYPLLTALVWRLGPPFPESAVALTALNVVLLACAGVVLAIWLARSGLVEGQRASVVAFLALLPGPLWSVAAIPLSESLFLVLLLLGFVAAGPLERTGASWKGMLSFLLLFALTVHTRSVGIALAAALCGALLVRRAVRRSLGIAAGCLLVMVPWAVASGRMTSAMEPGLRDLLGSYGPWWVEQVRMAPDAYLTYLRNNAGSLGRDATALLLPGLEGAGARGLALILWVAVGVGLLRVGRKSPTAGLFVLVYGLLVWAWPFQTARLLVPAAPLLMAALLLGTGSLLRTARSGWRVALAAAALGVVVTSVGLHAYALGLRRPVRSLEQRAEVLARALRSVAEHTPPEAVVGAPELWPAIHLYTGRRAVPSARFLPLQQEWPSWGSPDQQLSLWRATGVDHVLLEQGGAVHGETLNQLEARCPGTVTIVDRPEGMLLVRLDWAPACGAPGS